MRTVSRASFIALLYSRATAFSLIWIVLAGCLLAAESKAPQPPQSPQAVRQLVIDGNKAFYLKNYDYALGKYRDAQAAAPDSPYVNFDIGAALAEQGKHDEAMEAFRKVNSPDNPLLSAWALYNIGVSQYKQAEEAAKAKELDKARQLLESAMQSNREAMKIAPADEDPKYNYELAKRRLQEILEEMKKQQKEDQQKQDDQKKDEQKKDEQKPQQDQQKQDQQKQDQQKQDQQKQDQQKQDQQKQDEQKKDEQKQKQDQQKQNEQQKSDQQKKQEEAERQKQQEKQKQEQQKQAQEKRGSEKEKGQPGEDSQAQAKPLKPGEMSPEEARRILNSLPRQNLKEIQRFLRLQAGPASNSAMDW